MGATGTSLPLMGGLITARDPRQGRISQALAMGIPNAAKGRFRFPAQRGDGRTSGPDGIPQGVRFKLPADLKLDPDLPPLTVMIARAAQRYGIIVRDFSCVIDFYSERVSSPDNDPFLKALGGRYPSEVLGPFPWARLQVVAGG